MPEDSSRPLRIFLCHASEDKPRVRELYKRLCKDGFDVWFDEENLFPGQDWREEIPKAVEAADIVIVCLSRKSISKEGYVQKEIKFALDLADEKPEETIFIIPAKLEQCDAPRRLRSWQWVNLFDKDGYERLRNSLLVRANKLGLPESVRASQNTSSPAASIRKSQFIKGVEQLQKNAFALLRSRSVRWGLLVFGVLALIIASARLIVQQNQAPAVGTPTNTSVFLDGTQRPISPTSSKFVVGVTETVVESVQTAKATATLATSTPVVTPIPLTPQTPFSINPYTRTTSDAVLITLRDGNSKLVASDTMAYSGGGSIFWNLLTEFRFKEQGNIPFSEIKSLDFGEEQTNDYSVVIELISGKKIDDHLDNSYSYGDITGVMNDGKFKATFSEIRRMDFKQTADKVIVINMATVVNTAGEEIQTPADVLEAAFRGSGLAGPYRYTQDGWNLKAGSLIPFNLMKGFEIQKDPASYTYTMVYTLLDGRTLTGQVDTSGSPIIRGMTEFGEFNLDLTNIQRVDFHRTHTIVLPQLSELMANITLQDDTVYNIPAYWLAFKATIWKNSFSIVGYPDMNFNELKSLKVETKNDLSYKVTASIDLRNNQTRSGQMRLNGTSKVVGIDISGNYIEVAFKDVKQIDFIQGFTPPADTSMAKIIASDGTEFQLPANSVKLLITSSSWGYYSYTYIDEISLTTGIKVPFSKIKKFDVGQYDADAKGYPATLYLLDGQVVNSYFASSFDVSGFTDLGPFQMDMNQIQTVDFNK